MTAIGAIGNSTPYHSHFGKSENSNTEGTRAEFAETLKTNATADQKNIGNSERPAQYTTFMGQLLDLSEAVDLSNAKGIAIWEMPEDQYQEEMQFQQRSLESQRRELEARYMQKPEMPDRSNYAGDKTYAQILRDGRVVATISNEGTVETKGSLPNDVRESLLGSLNGTYGPDFAQVRAEQLAKAFGGKIAISDTALTQKEYLKLEKPEVGEITIDYDAMKKDPDYARLIKANEKFQSFHDRRNEYISDQDAAIDILS